MTSADNQKLDPCNGDGVCKDAHKHTRGICEVAQIQQTLDKETEQRNDDR
jgi:hypothetical protein